MLAHCLFRGSSSSSKPWAASAMASYTSRAHPRPTPVYAIEEAVQKVLQGVEERKAKRQAKWERNIPNRLHKGLTDDGPYRNQDETIELALNLNLDPRKPGQALRGAIKLPHGNGRNVKCIVFTSDPDTAQAALDAGALHAGGENLVARIVSGEVPLDFDRALASPEITGLLGKNLARTLGPRGLMPNAKVGTIVSQAKMVEALKEQLAGQAQYRTEKMGIVQLGVGKGSFASQQVLENLRTAMNAIFEVKPESFGKGKSGGGGKGKKGPGKNAKYLLTAHLTSTQGEGVKLDLRTVDPTSPFFMSTVIDV